jgi:flagellar protein FliS
MTQPSRDQYLESKVLTASQPQLHMMLLDGALRFGRNAKEIWAEGADFQQVDQKLARMADIVDELTHGTATAEQEVSKQLEEQYAFIYRELASCRINQTPKQLDNCLKLLAYQRETWKLATENVDAEPASMVVTSSKPATPHMNLDTAPASAGFSLEA